MKSQSLLSELTAAPFATAPIFLVAATTDPATALGALLCFALSFSAGIFTLRMCGKINAAHTCEILSVLCVTIAVPQSLSVLGAAFLPKIFARFDSSPMLAFACAFSAFCLVQTAREESDTALASLRIIPAIAPFVFILSFVREILSGKIFGMEIISPIYSFALAKAAPGGFIICALMLFFARWLAAYTKKKAEVKPIE